MATLSPWQLGIWQFRIVLGTYAPNMFLIRFQTNEFWGKNYFHFKEIPLHAILTRNISSNFPPEFLSICEYNSWKKPACHRPFKNQHFVGVCTEKMLDRQYRENGVRNTYSNCYQIRAYVECSPHQSKKVLPYRPFHWAIDETLRIPE